MKGEYFWSLLILAWVFGWAILWYLRRKAVEARALRLREMVHRERLAAIEKGVPLPEIPAEEEAESSWLTPEAERVRAAWLRRLALFLGCAAPFVGIGMCAGFYWSPDPGFHAMFLKILHDAENTGWPRGVRPTAFFGFYSAALAPDLREEPSNLFFCNRICRHPPKGWRDTVRPTGPPDPGFRSWSANCATTGGIVMHTQVTVND